MAGENQNWNKIVNAKPLAEYPSKNVKLKKEAESVFEEFGRKHKYLLDKWDSKKGYLFLLELDQMMVKGCQDAIFDLVKIIREME